MDSSVEYQNLVNLTKIAILQVYIHIELLGRRYTSAIYETSCINATDSRDHMPRILEGQ